MLSIYSHTILFFWIREGSICDLAESDPSQHFHMCQRSFFQVLDDLSVWDLEVLKMFKRVILSLSKYC